MVILDKMGKKQIEKEIASSTEFIIKKVFSVTWEIDRNHRGLY